MSARAASRLAWSLFTLSTALVAAGLTFTVLLAGVRLPAGAHDPSKLAAIFAPMALAWALIGGLIASRRRRERIGWLFCAVGLALAVSEATNAYSFYALYSNSEPLPGALAAAWLNSWLFIVGVAAGPVYLFLLFPDGHLPSRRWRTFAVLLGGLAVAGITAKALTPDLFRDAYPGFTNPLGLGGRLIRTLNAITAAIIPPAAFFSTAAAIVVRFRRSHGRERLQLRWVTAAAVFAAAGVILTRVIHTQIGLIFSMVGLVSIPVAAGVAILRHRLYEIDRVINRALVYGSLTACLATAYLGTVLLLQRALSPVTRRSELAVALSTLAVAALFRPARARIQQAVDRRFYRGRYDAARTLEAFTARLREEIDLDTLSAELRAVVDETMQPAHVSLWLRPVTTEEGMSR